MAQAARPWRLACLALLLAGAAAVDPRVARLQELEAKSKNGLITFDEALFNELALSEDRPYHLIVFGSAARLMDHPKVQLAKLKQEFLYAVQAYKAGPDAGKVFFVDMWFEQSSPVLSRLGLTTVPALFHWGPAQAGKPGKKIPLPKDAQCGGISSYPWPAESIATFIKGRTLLGHAPIDRPSFLKSPLFPLFALAVLAAGGWAAWRLYHSPLVRMTWLWALGALAVYGLSTSGFMFNIIRGMPMYIVERDGKVRWWLDQRGNQLGLEGMVMGSSYILFSGCISLMVYALPHVRDAKLRSGLSVAAAVLGAAVERDRKSVV